VLAFRARQPRAAATGRRCRWLRRSRRRHRGVPGGASDRVVGPSPDPSLAGRWRSLQLTSTHSVTITFVILTRSRPDMTLDYLVVLSDESSRIVDAYERDRHAAVPWSDRWTVATVARHVASTHHVVADIVRGRPDADFGLFGELQTPAKDSPEFVEWFCSGTTSLLEQLSNVPVDDECWSWFTPGRRVGWWARRMALEAVVHRWDTDAAQGRNFSLAPEIAADGIDEFLDVFVAATRAAHDAPAGPTISLECSDRRERWWLDLSDRGERTVSREPRDALVRIRGTAEQLLVMLWGRVPVTAGVEVTGDVGVLDRWSELIPPM